ncbi:stage II sporulation protein D [Clostridium sp. DL1XJH146]
MKRLLGTVLFIIAFMVFFSKIVIQNDNSEFEINTNQNEINQNEINQNEINQNNSEEKGIQVNQQSNNISVDVLLVENNKVIKLGLEDYVKGVVAAEMPAEFEFEALKAQAVAARTYVVAHIEEFGGNSNPKACKKGANVTDDVNCQVYMNKETRLKYWPESKGEEYWSKITKAVEETSGQVLAYEGQLVLSPFYFSTSAGNTQDSIDVFNKEIPYLKSVESPGEEGSPKYENEYLFNNADVVVRINNNVANTGVNTKNLSSQIRITSRSESGYIKTVQIGNVTMTGIEIRNIFNLNSSCFEFEFLTDEVKIITKGYGHGVGMSQWGADARAEEGMTYDQILKYYYTGVEIGIVR